tara:strand:- start:21 stop:656 length:636 start_codon:yes stop_codon:yes gene_type:complete
MLYLHLSALSICFAVALYYRKALNGDLKPIFWLLILSVITEAIGAYYLLMGERVVNNKIFHIYQPLEYIALALFFINVVENHKFKQIIRISIPIVTLAHILNSVYFQNLNQPPSNGFLLTSFFVCIWSMLFYYSILTIETEKKIWRNSNFIMGTGILFFYAGAFFVMGLIQIVSQYDIALGKRLFNINHVLNILMYSLFTYGIICKAKYPQ